MTQRHVRIVLQARTSSSRLPGKVLLPLGGLPLAVLCAKRLERTRTELVLATSDDPTDDVLTAAAERFGVSLFRGDLNDVLSRFAACAADLHEDDIVVRMTADNPVPDGAFVDQLVRALDERGTRYVSAQEGLPYGLGGEAFTVAALREADAFSETAYEREHVTPFIIARVGAAGALPGDYFVATDLRDLRCTIDTLNDYLLMCGVFDRLENPTEAPWHSLLALLPKASDHVGSGRLASGDVREGPSRITLGTAQLGMAYGIANRTGCPSADEGRAIVRSALSKGVAWFDTARTYGSSERRLGQELAAAQPTAVMIVTKLGPLADYPDNAEASVIAQAVDASVFRSCHALRRQCIDVMMFHVSSDMFRWRGAAADHLAELVHEGVIGELGVSVYTPEEAVRCMADACITHIQIPFNILDARWLHPAFQAAVGSRPDLKIHARSVFLQGLLTSDHTIWPKWFARSQDVVSQVAALRAALGRKSAADLCMAYVAAFPWVSTMVLGVERAAQLDELLMLSAEPSLSQEEVRRVQDAFRDIPDRLLNPSRW